MKLIKKIIKLLLGIFVFLLGLIIVINIAKYPLYKDYRASMKKEFKIPGLSDDFIPQALTYNDLYDTYFVSGYDKKTGAGIVYSGKDNKFKKIEILDGNANLKAHCGGIASYDDYVWVSDDSNKGSIYIFNTNDLINASDSVEIKEKFIASSDGASIGFYDNKIYVGEFYRKGNYETKSEHYYKENHSMVSVYEYKSDSITGFGNLVSYISIPDQAQGIAINGDVSYVSMSYGLKNSHLNSYNIIKTNDTLDGVSISYVGKESLVKEYKLPPMSEGIIYKDDRIYVLYESASNKYLFGKLYFQNYVESIKA